MILKKRLSIVSLFLVAVLMVSPLNIQSARADGETPTEPPTATAEQTEPPVQSTPEPEATTPVGEQATPVATSSGTPEALSSQESAPGENTPVTAILSSLPEETNIVVLGEAGEPLIIGSQQAADALASSDPVWCPAGIIPPTPGANGCSLSYASITELLTAMRTAPEAFDQNGTIFLETLASPGFTTPLILDDSPSSLAGSFATLSLYDLTVRGGWNPGSGTVSGTQSLFGVSSSDQGYISIGSAINPWVGNIALQDLEVRDVSVANSITVYTSSGDIRFDDVDVAQQTGGYYQVYLHSQSGNIWVGNQGNYDGNDAGDLSESRGFYAETTTGSITIIGSGTSYTFKDNEGIGALNFNGATLLAPSVTLTNVRAQANDGNGIEIFNASLVTLNNVMSSINTSAQSGNELSGVLVHGTGSTVVNVYGGTFAHNGLWGIQVFGGTLNLFNDPVCPTSGVTANGSGCYSVSTSDATPPVITPHVSGTVGNNGWYTSDVNVSWSVVDYETFISASSGCSTTAVTADTTGVTFTCSATSAGGSSTSSVTIKRDTAAPTNVSGAPNRLPDLGATYDHAVEIVFTGLDATSGIASCSIVPYSVPDAQGITINGSCTDQAGHTSSSVSSAFDYKTAILASPTPIINPTTGAPTSIASIPAPSNSPRIQTPVAGGHLISLDCDTVFRAFGVQLSFFNLCDQQARVQSVALGRLPASLPADVTFITGLHVDILMDGKFLEALPDGAGIQMDFPLGAASEYAVLHWDESTGAWTEISSELGSDRIPDVLSDPAAGSLYRLSGIPDSASYPILTTAPIGVFVLVKK